MVYDFGLRLKELREKKGLSQQEVANRLEVTKHTISGYERNIISPSIGLLVKLALLYGTSIDYMMGLDERPHIYLDGMTENHQKLIQDIVDRMKQEFQKK